MHVHDAAAEAEQVFAVDESQHFGRTGLTGGLQPGEVGQCLRAARGYAAGQFADDQPVNQYEVAIQKLDERVVTVAEVIHLEVSTRMQLTCVRQPARAGCPACRAGLRPARRAVGPTAP